MSYCCCSLAGTSACDHCANRPSEWLMPVSVIIPSFTFDSTNYPPQEFVPVVRCKDCIDWDKDGFCGITGREEPESHYCSYGKRREDDESN